MRKQLSNSQAGDFLGFGREVLEANRRGPLPIEIRWNGQEPSKESSPLLLETT